MIETRFGTIDQVLNGGFREGGLYVVADRYETELDSIMLQLAMHAVCGGRHVLYIDSLASDMELLMKMASILAVENREAAIKWNSIHSKKDKDEWDRAIGYLDDVEKFNIFFDREIMFPCTNEYTGMLKQAMDELEYAVEKNEIDAVFIRDIRIPKIMLPGNKRVKRSDPRRVLPELKAFAEEYEIPIIIGERVSEKVEDGYGYIAGKYDIKHSAEYLRYVDRTITITNEANALPFPDNVMTAWFRIESPEDNAKETVRMSWDCETGMFGE